MLFAKVHTVELLFWKTKNVTNVVNVFATHRNQYRPSNTGFVSYNLLNILRTKVLQRSGTKTAEVGNLITEKKE
jgi:hypothetical protein